MGYFLGEEKFMPLTHLDIKNIRNICLVQKIWGSGLQRHDAAVFSYMVVLINNVIALTTGNFALRK